MQEKMVEQAEAESNKLSLRTSSLTYLAKKQSLLGFTAEVLVGDFGFMRGLLRRLRPPPGAPPC
ncbi:MAG: hypothetical protein WCP70_05375 [Methanothrix sp.]